MGGLHRFGQQGEEPPHLPPGCGRTTKPGYTTPTLASADGCYWSPLQNGPGFIFILLITDIDDIVTLMFPFYDLYLQALHRLQFLFLTSSVVIMCQRFKGALVEGIHTRRLSPIIFLFPLPAPSASSPDLFVLFVLLQLFSLYKNVLQRLNWPYRSSGKVRCVQLTFSRLHTKASSNTAAEPLVIPYI